MIINYFISLFSFKRRDKFGLVYDQLTKKPIPAAIVRLFEFKSMKLVASTITDAKGHFYFPVNPGEYVITVIKTGFIFPAKSAKREDFIDRAYLGQTIRITGDASVINVKIPLDRTQKAKLRNSILLNLLLSNWIRCTVLIGGTALSSFILYTDPTRTHNMIVVFYLLLWIIELVVQNRNLKFNRVFDRSNRQPIDLAIIRVFSPKGRLVQTCFSDFQGRFIAKLREKGDKVSIERVGYKTVEFEPHFEGLLEGKRYYLNRI